MIIFPNNISPTDGGFSPTAAMATQLGYDIAQLCVQHYPTPYPTSYPMLNGIPHGIPRTPWGSYARFHRVAALPRYPMPTK